MSPIAVRSKSLPSAEQILAGMTLKEKIAQTIFPAVQARFPTDESVRLLVEDLRVGGLLLFRGGVRDGAALIGHLRSRSPHGLVVCSDMERGVGECLAGATSFPANLALGAAADEGLVRLQGEVTGSEARALGVDLVLAPVLDILDRTESPIVGTRSYGDDPDAVAGFGAAFIAGCGSSGCGTCAKHFPGHGAVSGDSHASLPVLEKGLDHLRSHELAPFARAISAGVDAVMIAHLRIPAIDSPDEIPASLSPKVIGSILREEMGFRGLVMTDALLMEGITSVMSEEEAGVRALAAGADVLLCPSDPYAIRRAVIQAVEGKALPPKRIEEAAERVLAFKERRGSLRGPADVQPAEIVNLNQLASGSEAARRAAEASICLLDDGGGLIPLEKGNPLMVILAPDRPDPWAGQAFFLEVSRRSCASVERLLPPWTDERIARIRRRAEKAPAVVWASIGRPSAWKDDFQVRADEILPSDARTVAVALGSPILLDHAPRATASICAFSDADVSQTAAARALFGEIPFRGRMPLTYGSWSRGHGLRSP